MLDKAFFHLLYLGNMSTIIPGSKDSNWVEKVDLLYLGKMSTIIPGSKDYNWVEKVYLLYLGKMSKKPGSKDSILGWKSWFALSRQDEQDSRKQRF